MYTSAVKKKKEKRLVEDLGAFLTISSAFLTCV